MIIHAFAFKTFSTWGFMHFPRQFTIMKSQVWAFSSIGDITETVISKGKIVMKFSPCVKACLLVLFARGRVKEKKKLSL